MLAEHVLIRVEQLAAKWEATYQSWDKPTDPRDEGMRRALFECLSELRTVLPRK